MGAVHRSMWSAEQWKLEPVNLTAQSSALCSHQLIFQLDFSLLVLCGGKADTPWFQKDSWAGPRAMWAVAAALLPGEQSALVPSNHSWIQLLFQCAMDRGAWLSLYQPLEDVFCVLSSLAVNFWFIWWERYTRLCLPHPLSLCVAAFSWDYLF